MIPRKRPLATRPRLIVLIAVALIAGWLLPAALMPSLEAQAIADVVFLPQTYYVGDIVEVRVVVRATETMDLRTPDVLPSTDWVDIRAVQIVRRADGFEVRIQFQPFFVGTRQLPGIDLGSMELVGVGAVVSSLGERDGQLEIEPIRDQLLLPGTRLLILVVIVGLVGVPAAVLLAGEWGKRTLFALVRRYRERRPYRTTMRILRTLQSELLQLDGRRYYIRLLDIARHYFDGRFDASLSSATTGEVGRRLDAVGIDPEVRDEAVALFRFGDLVKFANHPVGIEDRERHLESLRSIIARVQKLQRETPRVGA